MLLLYMNLSACAVDSSLLAVVLMVKNEAAVLHKTLKPLFEAGIQQYLILDTGSEDGTVCVARDLFAAYGIAQGHIIEQPFVDFATSRNSALRAAEAQFPHAQFLLLLDAEWEIFGVAELLTFCARHTVSNQKSFLIKIINGDLEYDTAALIKAHAGVCYVGPVHEVIAVPAVIKVPAPTQIVHKQSKNGAEKSRMRWARDKLILLKEYEKNNNDPRTLFYLGQTCFCLGEYEQACIWYQKRCAIRGWEEEDFVARYNLAQAYEASGNWAEAEKQYQHASALRPTRAEPLVRLALHYWQEKQYEQCFAYAQQAVQIPYPAQDILFIEKKLYTFTRHDLLGLAAWHVGAYELGKKITKKLLEQFPDEPHLHFNLALYLNRDHCT